MPRLVVRLLSRKRSGQAVSRKDLFFVLSKKNTSAWSRRVETLRYHNTSLQDGPCWGGLVTVSWFDPSINSG